MVKRCYVQNANVGHVRMFKVNGHALIEDDMTVLNTLKSELAKVGVERFREFKVMPQDIQTNCPMHAGKNGIVGQEGRPSCGIATIDKHTYGDRVIEAGTVHCFTCGYTASLGEMISNLFGHDDQGRYGNRWLVKNFLSVAIENRRELNIDFDRTKVREKVTYIKESELEKYRYYHDYMFERKLTEEVIEQFDLGYDGKYKVGDKRTPCITFPQRDKDGNTLFVSRRSVKGKHFNIPSGSSKALYGLHEYLQMENPPSTVLLVEGQIDALTSWVYGKPAFGLYGTGSEEQYEMLKRLPVREYVLALDDDDAGRIGERKLNRRLKATQIISKLEIGDGRDINDLTKDEFDNLEITFY